MYNYNKYIEKVKSFYVKFSRNKEKNTSDYLSKINVHNDLTGETTNLHFDLFSKYVNDSLYYLNVIDYINELTDKKGLIPLFITLTSPSELHFFKKNGKNIILNKNYENYNKVLKLTKSKTKKEKKDLLVLEELTQSIKKSYKLLQKESRDIIRNYQRKNGEGKIYYFKMFEYHKTLTPHLHLMVFVEKDILNNFVKLVGKRMRKHNIKQFDIKVLIKDDKRNGIKYVSKYITKMLKNKDIVYLLDGWKKYNKVRLFSFSQVGIPRYVFNKLVKYKDLVNIKLDGGDTFVNLYKELNKKTKHFKYKELGEEEFFKKTKQKIKQNKRKDKHFLVLTNIKKYDKNILEYNLKISLKKLDNLFFTILKKYGNNYKRKFFTFRKIVNDKFNELHNNFWNVDELLFLLDFVDLQTYLQITNNKNKEEKKLFFKLYNLLKQYINSFWLEYVNLYYLKDYVIYFFNGDKYVKIYDKNNISFSFNCII